MQKTCANPWCKTSFEVTQDDLQFLEKISPVSGGKKELIPPPKLCPDCRMQRRVSWRNERTLYKRTCNLTGESIISMYSAEKPFPVYQQKKWWSDEWDPLNYGRDIALTASFLDQFAALLRVVPVASLHNVLCEQNCDYVNIEYDDKNCFMCFGGGYCEDCEYGNVVIRSKNCVDCLKLNLCEQCYELMYSERCNRCFFSQNLQGCNNCWLCYDCQGCSDCFGCAGLRNKHHCFLNEQLSPGDYQAHMQEVQTGHFSHMQEHARRFRNDILLKSIHRYARILASEECIGDYITNSQNCFHCFEVDESRDLKYVTLAEGLKDSRDCYITGWPAELCYDSMSQCLNAYHNSFSNFCWDGSAELLYCDHCFACQHCFGCVGLRHRQYCILNKQYTKEAYERLVSQTIKHMRKTDDWGEFFPVSMSPFAYNETVAQEYFPMTKGEVLNRGWKWREQKDEMPKANKVILAAELPNSIDDIPDDILNWAIQCEVTGRPFKITKQELGFYRQMKLSIPHLHPDERYDRRLALRNPRKLWGRKCMKCQKAIQTTYAPERPEIVFCEECYLKEVY
ncbi:MAG: hypothetical protein PHH13_02885 [Candidatus Peribacteraceae bacterium]|nr:hypothetical protein [Candidatus Peribacteraceae bacterium]